MSEVNAPACFRARINGGVVRTCLLVKKGYKNAQVAWIEETGVKLSSIPLKKLAKFAELDYDPKLAARRMLVAGESLGISRAASNALKGLLSTKASAA